MPLPFQTLQTPETAVVSGILVRKRGCLTVAEEQALRDLGATLEKGLEGLTTYQADLALKQRVVSILIQSRLDRSWTLEKTQAPEWEITIDGNAQVIEPDMVILDGLYEFFMTEQSRGKSPEELQITTDTKKKK
jgi:hypothetical protein